MLILLLCFYMLVAHWLACIWYTIGRGDAENGLTYSWPWKLANTTQRYYRYELRNDTFEHELVAGPSRESMYISSLYFTMTCMTSVGFGASLISYIFITHFSYHIIHMPCTIYLTYIKYVLNYIQDNMWDNTKDKM
jgi:hypothetical protein